jgi:hypothetical protein
MSIEEEKVQGKVIHNIFNKIITEIKERILKAVREKIQITYKYEHIKIMPDFSTGTFKSKKDME